MKIVYDREDDVLTVEILPDRLIDHAKQSGPLIAHFDPEGRLVLLEILDASAFIGTIIQANLKEQAEIVTDAVG